MRYFFFGTLMDQDVLAKVIGRCPTPGMSRSATLAGYRRVQARGESYPVLVADPAARTTGRLVDELDARDSARIAFFEELEYGAERCTVMLADGGEVEALVHIRTTLDAAATEEWTLDGFVATEKADLLVLTEEWMTFLESGDFEAANRAWDRTEARLVATRQRRAAAGHP